MAPSPLSIHPLHAPPHQDTSKDSNPLYAQRLEVTPLFGRGYVAGVDMREQRKHNRYLEALTIKRQVRAGLLTRDDGGFQILVSSFFPL